MKTIKTESKKRTGSLLFFIALAGTVLSIPVSAQANVIDWTNQSSNQIDAYNTQTGAQTVVNANAPTSDSLVFANSGNSIIYGSNPSTGSNLYLYNISSKTNTVLASGASLGGANAIRDLALTPRGNSALVSSFNGSTVNKVNIASGAVSTFTSGYQPQGLAFTPSGNLFLNLGAGIEQINYQTGKVIQTNFTNGSLDGLTYNPTTGFLYATNGTNNILQIDPRNLTEKSITLSGSGIASPLNLDGIEATQNGNLIIANYYNNMLEYYTASNTTTVVAGNSIANGIDDVAPLVGLGSAISGAPEPGTFALFGTGILLLALFASQSVKNQSSAKKSIVL